MVNVVMNPVGMTATQTKGDSSDHRSQERDGWFETPVDSTIPRREVR
jgi:hypothetical protein